MNSHIYNFYLSNQIKKIELLFFNKYKIKFIKNYYKLIVNFTMY